MWPQNQSREVKAHAPEVWGTVFSLALLFHDGPSGLLTRDQIAEMRPCKLSPDSATSHSTATVLCLLAIHGGTSALRGDFPVISLVGVLYSCVGELEWEVVQELRHSSRGLE